MNISTFLTLISLATMALTSCGDGDKPKSSVTADSGKSATSSRTVAEQPQVMLSSTTIGKQTWTNRNFNGTTYRNGDPIPECKTAEEWQRNHMQGIGCWCWYDNNPEMNDYYGKIYNFYAMTDAREIAPKGWHVPTKYEWEEMYMALGGLYNSQPKLKSPNGWFRETNGTDESGFFGTAGGYRTDDGQFIELTRFGMWWSAVDEEGQTWIQNLSYNDGDPSRRYGTRGGGFSLRFVKD